LHCGSQDDAPVPVKFDGWRIQLHKHGGSPAAFTKNGHDHSRRDAPYRSGKQCGWVKVKCATWREANKERWRLFERHR
jgi:ATP-dependent DNA ligase